MTTTTPAATPAKTATKTTYVILSREGSTGAWKEATARQQAASSDAAIRAAVGDAKGLDGLDSREWIAVPARSWTPRKIKVETVSKVTLG